MITPPTSGPIATAPPIVAPQTPNAVARSLPWNSWPISASEVANIAGAADPLQAAGEVEQGRVAGDPAEERGEGEDREAEREDAAAAEPVAERAGGEQEGGERQRVGVDDPLQAGEAGVRVRAGCRAGRR